MKTIKSICIFSRITRIPINSIIDIAIKSCKKFNVEYSIESNTSSLLNRKDIPIHNLEHHTPDCFLVVGGDGSMLQAAALAVNKGIPLLGINTGKLGFLVDINPKEIQQCLSSIFCGEYSIESRPTLQWQTDITNGIAINEVVIKSTETVSMANFELIINDSSIYHQQSDGLIVSTPTGSTAYSLSAGGPILVPYLPVIALTPICAHKLNTRPLVISNQDKVTIQPLKNDLDICCDGSKPQKLYLTDKLIISQGSQPLKLIHPYTYDYYTSLKLKLGWEKSYAD
jgi:NAD+ kinase